MAATSSIDHILHDCLFAVGQAVGSAKPVDAQALGWWRERYRTAFGQALAVGNSWDRDRHRVMAVGRFLGERALVHADGRAAIDLESARKASAEVESGCRMNAIREGVTDLRAAFPHSVLVS